MFNRILLCLDGTPLAEQMIPYAAEVAEKFGSELVLLQVLQVPSSLAAASAQGAESVIEEEMKRLAFESSTYLNGVAERLRARGLSVHTVTLEGMPGDAIVDYARKNDIGLIAIATHGRKNLGLLVFGSVADHVLRHTNVPVLTLKPQEAKR
ncbi:MAG TPA: universal stress protein [Dehalococcoidia bacterium]|nr:universal stress protein [Dehalococcoidia bacterium]